MLAQDVYVKINVFYNQPLSLSHIIEKHASIIYKSQTGVSYTNIDHLNIHFCLCQIFGTVCVTFFTGEFRLENEILQPVFLKENKTIYMHNSVLL